MRLEPCELLKKEPEVTPVWENKGIACSGELCDILDQVLISKVDPGKYRLRVMRSDSSASDTPEVAADFFHCRLCATAINDDGTISIVVDTTNSDEANSPYFKLTFTFPEQGKSLPKFVDVDIAQFSLWKDEVSSQGKKHAQSKEMRPLCPHGLRRW